MTYAYVTNGTVDRTGPLPQTWENPDGSTVSNFNLLPDTQVRDAGWWPITEQYATLTANQHYGAPTYTVDTQARTVTATYPAEADPPATINQRTLNTNVDAALTALAAFQTANATARTQLATAKAQAQTKSTSASVTSFPTAQAEVRALYAGVVTALGQLDAALAALDTATRAAATALRITAGRLDSTTGT